MTASGDPITHGRRLGELQLGGLRLVETRTEAERVLRPHCHDRGNVSLLFDGSVTEWVLGSPGRKAQGPQRASAASSVIKPSGTVHRNHFGRRCTRAFVIEVAPKRERELGLDRWGGWLHGGPAVGRLLRVYEAFQRCDPDLEPLCLEALRELLASSQVTFEPQRLSPASTGLLDRAHQVLRSSPRMPGAGQLAAEVGVHPVYLARLFRAVHGVGIAGYRKRLRVLAAAGRLAQARPGLCEVAVATGFSDQSHLTRAFRSELGITPAAYRALAARQDPA